VNHGCLYGRYVLVQPTGLAVQRSYGSGETAQYDSAHNVSQCDDCWITADATSFFQRAATNNVPTPTIGLRAVNEADASQYKQFWSYNYTDAAKYPYVEVTYSEPVQPVSDAT
jgi:hypothetical protein